jgi:hypothetical protein
MAWNFAPVSSCPSLRSVWSVSLLQLLVWVAGVGLVVLAAGLGCRDVDQKQQAASNQSCQPQQQTV